VNALNAKKTHRLLWLSAVVFAFVSAPAHAEVLELEGTVKAVDASARTMSVERKTPKGTKTLELEVNKKAGDLSSVKVGDRITLSYDPDLELVTKFGGRASGESETETEVCRITYSISDTGDCRLRLEKTKPSEGKTDKIKQQDGTWVCRHFFASPSEVDSFDSPFGPVVNVRVDEARNRLVFAAETAKGFDKKASQITYPTRFRVPFEVSIELAATGKDFLFQINPMPTQLGQRQAIVNIKSDDALKSEAKVAVASMTRDAQGKPTFDPPLLEEETISLTKPWEKRFRLPVPNVRSRDAYTLRLGLIGESDVISSSLTLAGFPVPSLGIKLGEKSGVVFAENIVPNSLSDKAGFKAGDVVLSVGDKKPTTANEMMDLIADMPFNEPSKITIQRGDATKTLSITPTFGKK
jgi:hypothetical protein